MSDTPRTDRCLQSLSVKILDAELSRMTEHAREIERELNQASDVATDLYYLNEALTRKLAYYERYCQDVKGTE